MQYQQVYDFLMPRLENELPAWLTYHNAGHTRYVIDHVELLAATENVTGDDLILLKTAALFHDAGFLQQSHGHEEISCIMAREILPDFEYSDQQIEHICRIVIATQLPQHPTDKLGEILCDADLYYILEKNYSANAEKMFLEFHHTGEVKNETEWLLRQVEFLSGHKYFTPSANSRMEGKTEAILKDLNSRLDKDFSHKKEHVDLSWIQDVILSLLGVVFAGGALKLFLVPNQFFDGGVTGMALLVHEIYHFNLAIVILVLNLPLIIVSYFSIGKRFAWRTVICVILLGIALWLIPEMAVTNDKFLISIMGGAFLGIGVGLIMRTGAALDGIEVLAVYTLKRTSFTITEIILGINIIIFGIAAFKFGIPTALYSIITYFTATRCIDYVVEGLQAYTGVTIVSGKSEAIKYQLVNKLGRGITVYKGERGFLPGKYDISADCDIIFTVITRLEMRKLKNLVYDVDPKAFVFANTIKEASGGIIKRRQHH
jgi:uncharacterized membrane-anchored protein YitT (DUF2179 family)/predicted metal-dependent HD superfamily phosphohydrolase